MGSLLLRRRGPGSFRCDDSKDGCNREAEENKCFNGHKFCLMRKAGVNVDLTGPGSGIAADGRILGCKCGKCQACSGFGEAGFDNRVTKCRPVRCCNRQNALIGG